ncbi:MAG TPA: hypothetical protein VK541_13430 [Pedobacter sp.]|uniref:hypothetical protein n=1 Tax=Pedobacter sp. TaxID=1411316 RepID=UPI002BE6208E|nr:hypothetical protein [Pedobacter sp.]HMI03485.1 hypothetical protein [Pedobacter sp.]
MKKIFKQSALILGIGAMTLVGCKKDSDQSGNFNKAANAGSMTNGRPCESIPVDANGIITVSSLDNDHNWKLDGVAYVAPGNTLTIEQGAVIVTGATKTYNDPLFGPQTLAGVLVVPVGAKIEAIGTASEPIIFTTPQRAGCSGAGCNIAGNFGGVVILGDATINQGPTRIEGVPQPAGASLLYGGSDDTDDSGTLRYVRIEFPGYRLDADNEINGLTLGGVGSGTELSNIQVSYSADDSFEFFGGTVNADHLVALASDDDDFDFDLGYKGTINFALGLKNPNSTHSTSGGSSDSNGIESDNNAGGSTTTVITKPVLRHFTLLGYATSGSTTLANGNRWRRATGLDIQQSVIAGFPTGAVFQNITAAGSVFDDNIVHAYTTISSNIGGNPATFSILPAEQSTAATANSYLLLGPALGSAPFLTCANSSTYNPAHLIPRTGSPAFGTATTFKGAFQPGVTAWTATWTDFNPGFCCN